MKNCFELQSAMHGWKIMYVPTALFIIRLYPHRLNEPVAVYYSARNSVFVQVKKHSPFPVFRCFTMLFGDGIGVHIFRGEDRHPILYLGQNHALSYVCIMLKKRRENLKERSEVDRRGLKAIMNSSF
jgi:hypothetical protein